MEQFFISSPIGLLEVCIQKNRLYSISRMDFKKVSAKEKRGFLKIADQNTSYFSDENSSHVLKRQKLSPLARKIKIQLGKYFDGKLKKFDIPLMNRGTDFQKKVWRSLQKIPFGRTQTYGQVAGRLKVPYGSRAVGSSCARNPFLIVVPCHRVLSQNGLGGFALGLKAKRQLLSLEKTL